MNIKIGNKKVNTADTRIVITTSEVWVFLELKKLFARFITIYNTKTSFYNVSKFKKEKLDNDEVT